MEIYLGDYQSKNYVYTALKMSDSEESIFDLSNIRQKYVVIYIYIHIIYNFN